MKINLYREDLRLEGPINLIDDCKDSRGLKFQNFGPHIMQGGRPFKLFKIEYVDGVGYQTYKCFCRKDCPAILSFNRNTRVLNSLCEHASNCKIISRNKV